MNLALSTVLIFIIVSPGLIARLSYFTFPFSNQARSSDFTKEVFWAIIPGFFIHFIYIGIIETTTKFFLKFSDISFLLLGKEDNYRLNKISLNIHENLGYISSYFVGLFLFSFLIGFLSKKIVLRYRLDKWSFFRFTNKWYYLLSGRILDVEPLEGDSSNIGIVGIDVLCNVGGNQIIYIGFLNNYYLSGNGDLDAITLKYPVRRPLIVNSMQQQSETQQVDNESIYYTIPSDILYIPNKDIVNINIRYFSVENA
ncbi:MAG: hypothetical protein SFU21_05015 [Flavihumibacter sp.]|nr:hypothetical protein [Flavihumibacter sp.]